MKVKKLLAGMISAAVVIGAMTVSAFAEDGTAVAKIGNTEYTSLKAAMQAACDLYSEDFDAATGISTRTEPVTIELIADIKNQEGFIVRGGQIKTGYNQGHYVHNIDITINGNGHKIDTNKKGGNLDSVKSPKIELGSVGGKLIVKNIVAPNDLVFNVEKGIDNYTLCKEDSAQAESLTVEDSIFYGSNVAYSEQVNSITYKNNKFLLTEGTSANNPEGYPLWYKFGRTIKNFTFEGNTVKAQRPVHLCRLSNNTDIICTNNSFTIDNTDKKSKSCAIMFADIDNYVGTVTFNGNTVNAYSTICVHTPTADNTKFKITAKDNTLAKNTKLVGYNEWSFSDSDTDKKTTAEGLIKALADKANTGTTDPEILANSLYVTYSELGKFDFGSGEADSIKLTLFAGVDTLDYSSVGFDVTVGKETQSFPITTVYTSVKTMLGGKETTVKAADFGSGVNYIFGQTINFPATTEFADASANWTPFAMKNGKKITVKTFNLADIFPGTLTQEVK